MSMEEYYKQLLERIEKLNKVEWDINELDSAVQTISVLGLKIKIDELKAEAKGFALACQQALKEKDMFIRFKQQEAVVELAKKEGHLENKAFGIPIKVDNSMPEDCIKLCDEEGHLQ